MKKHDEGYVLAYVTVVLLVFCLVATTILTGALNNLQNQQNAIAQMQDQYAAAGMIEQVVSQWDAYKPFTENTVIGDTGVVCDSVEDGVVTLTAKSGTFAITCKIDMDTKKYLAYDVITMEAAPPAPENDINGEVPQ
jgi:type II secretory pathway pseudopilin PulG